MLFSLMNSNHRALPPETQEKFLLSCSQRDLFGVHRMSQVHFFLSAQECEVTARGNLLTRVG